MRDCESLIVRVKPAVKEGVVLDKLRNSEYDKLRAIGIVLVVLGHTLGIGDYLDKYIYSFHMPLFFFISGLMLTESRLAQAWSDASRHYALRLLVPYFLFSLITYVPWVIFTRHYGADVALNIPVWKPLLGTFYGIGVNVWLQHNAMLWFFPCLFVVHMVFRLLHRVCCGAWKLGGVLLCAAVGYGIVTFIPARLPWGVEVALLAIPFYAVGYELSVRGSEWVRPGIVAFFVMLGFGLLQGIAIAINGRVDMNFLSFGNPLLFYLGAFCGIGALVGLVVFLPMHPLYTRMADSTMIAFPLHRLFFSVLQASGFC